MGSLIRFFMLREIYRAIRQIIPWMGRTFMDIVKFMGMVVFTFWRNVPATSKGIALTWQQHAINAGFPMEHDRTLLIVLWILAYAMLVAGWILCSFVTITILRLVF